LKLRRSLLGPSYTWHKGRYARSIREQPGERHRQPWRWQRHPSELWVVVLRHVPCWKACRPAMFRNQLRTNAPACGTAIQLLRTTAPLLRSKTRRRRAEMVGVLMDALRSIRWRATMRLGDRFEADTCVSPMPSHYGRSSVALDRTRGRGPLLKPCSPGTGKNAISPRSETYVWRAAAARSTSPSLV
jgi:hypothetical protein